jgi:hypothetical protein
MVSVLILAALLAAGGEALTDHTSAALAWIATPIPLYTPAPLPGVLPSPTPIPTPVPSPTPIVNTFANVTLGDLRNVVRKNLGKPREVDPVNIGEMWRYTTDGGKASLSVIFVNDAALSITLSVIGAKKSSIADPYGVTMGMTVDQLTSVRGQPITVSDSGNRVYGDPSGVRWVYGFDSGLVTDINVSQPVQSSATPAPATIDASSGRDGRDFDHAIIVNASSTGSGTDLEYRYIKTLSCNLSGAWNIITQQTVAVGARWYDEFDLTCSSDKTTRALYFDVTSYAGK